jgi:N-acetylmuramic acid 6-phosphate (MurNAc-6-P) etherase
MVDVQMGSEKLKDRARRIIAIVTGLDYDAPTRCCGGALERQGGDS